MAKTLAEKTEWLFQHCRNPRDNAPYSNARLAHRIEALCGFSVTPTTIWNIRTGRSDNPSWKLIEGIAKAFGVSTLYFTDENAEDRTQEELALLEVLRDADVRTLALRAHGLSPASLETVRGMVERVRELEGVVDVLHRREADVADAENPTGGQSRREGDEHASGSAEPNERVSD